MYNRHEIFLTLVLTTKTTQFDGGMLLFPIRLYYYYRDI